MNNAQYLLVKLAEEASELSQIALKAAQFGPYEKYEKAGKDNVGRIQDEFNDVLGVVEKLSMECGIQINKDKEAILAKMNKINHYRKYSVDCGCHDGNIYNWENGDGR